jgi:RNA polymerase sigma-70 factor (ECF subfamily)
MDEPEWLAGRFEEHRTRLRPVAYRMLGSLSEADDAMQEAWLRLNRTDASGHENLGGWLTTVVARISLNMLRSCKAGREEPLAGRLPDLLIDRVDGIDPEHEALLADSVGFALLVVLDTLSPPERLAFVLHDRRVEDDHKEGPAQQCQCPPAARVGSGSWCPRPLRPFHL